MRLWTRWVELCGRREAVLPLALTRIALAGVLLADLLRIAQLGLVGSLWRPFEHGGLGGRYTSSALLDDAAAWAGPATWGLNVLALVLVILGIGTRPALVVAVLTNAQLGHLYPAGDRAIDRLIRTVFLVLALSGSHRGLTVLVRDARTLVSTVPAMLIRVLLVVVYTCAGVGKAVSGAWLTWAKYPALYRIVADPTAGTLDSMQVLALRPLFQVAGWLTVGWEVSAFLLLTRWAPWWGIGGVLMHLGIFSMMDLGMFSWGMLAMYPLVFSRWIQNWK
jgi:hypothetical protein